MRTTCDVIPRKDHVRHDTPRHGTSMDALDRKGGTALYDASQGGHPEVVRQSQSWRSFARS